MPVPHRTYLRPIVLFQIALVTLVSILVSDTERYQDASASVISHETMTYVLLLNPECDYEFRDNFASDLRINNTTYEQHIGKYYVVCMGGVQDLQELELYTIPVLRFHLPDDTFLFVYPESMNEQYYDYMEDKFGSQYRYSAAGNTDVLKGVAYAKESPYYIKHELAHLATCGTWHDAEGNDTGSLIRHPEADHLDWCPLARQ